MNGNVGKFGRYLAIIVAILSGCASGQKEPLILSSDFRQQEVHRIALVPVTFEERYAPPFGSDLARNMESKAIAALEEKGYEVNRRSAPQSGGSDAIMSIHVDFLFISETWADTTPPPVIDIEAEGRLVSASTGEVLWRDRGAGKAGGAGGDRIRRPVLEQQIVLSILIETLFDSLPNAPARP